MHIAYDATALPPRPVGAGNYIIYLLRALIDLKADLRFSVFVQPYQHALLDLSPHADVDFISVPAMPPAVRLLWEQTIFPRLVLKSGAELLHSPHYTMPLSHPVPNIVTFHDMSFFIYPEKHTWAKRYFFPWMMRQSARRADIIISDSENTRQDAIRFLKICPEKIVTVHLGHQNIFRRIADKNLLARVRQQYDLPEQYIFYAGALEPRKNVPMLLNAFEQLAQSRPELHLVMTGGTGWGNQETLALMNSLSFKDRILRLGHIDHADLPAIFNLAAAFVYPSLYEGFGLPPLEGLACGTPVITTNISSMPEVVGDAGMLVPPNNETALVRAIQQALDDDSLRQRLQEAGPRQAANFTWKHTAEKTLKVYQQALSTQ